MSYRRRIREVFERASRQRRRGIRILRIDERRSFRTVIAWFDCGDLESEIDCLLLAKAGHHRVILLRLKLVRFHLNRIRTRLELREVESPVLVGFDGSLLPVICAEMVTDAPAMGAPRLSVTVPTMALVVSPCPQREERQTPRSAVRSNLGMPKVYT